MPSHKIYITPLARLDIEEIWAYTFYTWSEIQADKYQYEIYAGFKQIGLNCDIGRSADKIKPGYRRYKVNHHYIFYVLEEDRVKIVRVLHEKMDIVKHLHR